MEKPDQPFTCGFEQHLKQTGVSVGSSSEGRSLKRWMCQHRLAGTEEASVCPGVSGRRQLILNKELQLTGVRPPHTTNCQRSSGGATK